MSRKNLNDAIHGDRASIRGGQVNPPATRSWDDFQKEKSRQGSLDAMFDDPGRKPHYKPTQASTNSGYNANVKTTKTDTGKSANLMDQGRCYHKHPPLKLPGTDILIYGGSCSNPIVKDADVYIGFDWGMRFTQRSWPWKKGIEFLFEIKDFNAPDDFEEFEKLVNWSKKALEEGKKIHCGCIGGHGRTGTFLAALVSKFGEKDAITYVRDNYCPKVVESTAQVKFLEKHYGILPVKGSKEGTKTGGSSNLPALSSPSNGSKGTFSPEPANGSIWTPRRA